MDLVILNPRVTEQKLSGELLWSAADLEGVARAIVGVRGWHSERFYPTTFDLQPDILKFVGPESLKFGKRILGNGPMAKILCLPRLPMSGQLKAKTIDVLREKGIDGVLSFETIVAELILRVDVNKNYEKSDLLQIIRILKNYDLLKDPQLDFFAHRGKSVPRRRRAAAKPEAESKPAPAAPSPQPADAEAPAGTGG